MLTIVAEIWQPLKTSISINDQILVSLYCPCPNEHTGIKKIVNSQKSQSVAVCFTCP